jgi:hypothetical protein
MASACHTAPSRTIKCGLCGGNGLSCLDCTGVHGTAVYDQCDVCGGNGRHNDL